MNHRFAKLCAGPVLGASGFCLLVWGVFWRPLAVLHPEPWLYLPPISALALGIVAIGLLTLAGGGSARRVYGSAIAAGLLAAAVLAEHIFAMQGGLERLLFDDQVRSELAGQHPGRPAALVAMCVIVMALSLVLALGRHQGRLNPVDICALLVLFPSFTILLGYVFQADSLVSVARQEESPVHLPEVLLLMLLSLGALSLNPRGALATLRELNAGGAAKRRLLPPAMLTPILLGAIQALALHAELLDPVLAVALTAAVGIFVSIVLIEWVSGLLTEREAEQEGELLQREMQAREQGMTDMLTGLLNRRGWEHHVGLLEDRYQRQGGNACVIVIDLDGLKGINDTEGHSAGDLLIRKAGRALQMVGRREDHIARLGGDEFAYLAVDCQPQHADIVMRRLAESMNRAGVQASLGYAMRDLAGSLYAAFQEADQAMYLHKRQRKGQAKTADSDPAAPRGLAKPGPVA